MLEKVYPAFHPSKALEDLDVVLANKKIPVMAIPQLTGIKARGEEKVPVEHARVPFLPRYGSSTAQPAANAAGTATTLNMACYQTC